MMPNIVVNIFWRAECIGCRRVVIEFVFLNFVVVCYLALSTKKNNSIHQKKRFG